MLGGRQPHSLFYARRPSPVPGLSALMVEPGPTPARHRSCERRVGHLPRSRLRRNGHHVARHSHKFFSSLVFRSRVTLLTRRYPEGLTTLDVIDRSTGALIYRAEVTDEIGKNLDKNVAKALDQALKKFPVKEISKRCLQSSSKHGPPDPP